MYEAVARVELLSEINSIARNGSNVLKRMVARIEDTKVAKYLSQEPTFRNEVLGTVAERRASSSSLAKRFSPCSSLSVDSPQSATKFWQLPLPAFDLDSLTEPDSDRVPTPDLHMVPAPVKKAL